MNLKSNVYFSVKWMELLWVLPQLLVVAILPLIVRLRVIELSPIDKVLYQNREHYFDFFYKVRAEGIILLSVIAIILLIVSVLFFERKIKFQWFFIPALIYMLLVIASTFVASYRGVFIDNYTGVLSDPGVIATSSNLALRGYLDRFEGLYVTIAYCVLFFTGYIQIRSRYQIRILLFGMVLPGAIMGIVAFFQYVGMDPFQTSFGMSLMVPDKYAYIKETIEFSLSSSYSIGLMNNPNYLGGYMAVLLLLSIGLYSDTKRRRVMISLFFVSVLIFIGLMTSNSSTGIMSVGFGFLLYISITYKYYVQHLTKTLVLLGSFALIVVLLNGISDNRIDSEIGSMKDELEMMSGEYSNKKGTIEAIDQIDQGLKIVTDRFSICIHIEGTTLYILNSSDEVIAYQREGKQIILPDDRYEGLTIRILESNGGLDITYDDKSFFCAFRQDGIDVIGVGTQVFPTDKKAPHIGFDGMGTFASNRGHIWSYSFPLLKGTTLLGRGPDTYVAIYPHYDVLANINGMRKSTRLIDKPHNIYIQTAVNTGWISLIMLVILMLGCTTKIVIRYVTMEKPDSQIIEVALAISLVVFAITGLANDSVITITSLAWIMMSLGYRMLESGEEC